MNREFPEHEAPPTILDINGNDPEEENFRKMLQHWLSIRQVCIELGKAGYLPNQSELEMIYQGKSGQYNKAHLSRITRKILLHKPARKLIASVILSTHPEKKYSDILTGLKQIAFEAKPLASAAQAGLIVP